MENLNANTLTIDHHSDPPVGPEHLSITQGLDLPNDVFSSDEVNAVVRRIKCARDYAERVTRWAQQEKRRAEREEVALLSRYGPLLTAWLQHELSERRRRTKTVHLPAGSVAFRMAPDHLEITDAARLWQWCSMNLPHSVRLTIEADGPTAVRIADLLRNEDGVERDRYFWMDRLKRHVLGSTANIPGVYVRPGFDRLLVR